MIKYSAKQKLYFFLMTALMATIFSAVAYPVYSASLHTPVHFDFGPDNSKIKTGANQVTENTAYKKATGFGLIQSADQAFLLDDWSLKDEMTIDGIRSKDGIKFRVDLPAGDYWIELFMEAGSRSIWVGEIRANQVLVVDSIFQYGVSFEEEQPPVYWSILKPVKNTNDHLELIIKAQNQETTVTGISIYDNDFGPLRLFNGQYVTSPPLTAPNASLALKLLNRGAVSEAQRYIDQLPEDNCRYEKALLLMALAGRLEIDDPRAYIDLAAKLLKDEFQSNKKSDLALNLRLATLYSEGDMCYKMGGWEWAVAYTGEGIFSRLNIAGHKMKKVFEVTNHPLNHRAAFYLGRLSFHAWVEQHDRWQKIRADRLFDYLKPYYPDFRLLKIYMGEQLIADDAIPFTPPVSVPEWVSQTNLALKSLVDVIHYWVDFRQADNGEFGGKYDDDVEMLRWWPIARLALNDPKTLLGMQRLVDGVWNSDWITNGFSTKVRDVEHAAEPVADTQPMMIGLDYGNPIYVERCMESIKGLRDVWTDINKRGHRHFKSSWYSYNQIDTRPPRDCDVEMNARTVKAARWLAWYNRHPFAMQFLTEWSDAWLEDCRRTDKGKPYGIVPAAIRYEDDAIGGHADNWHHPGMFWSYYDFNGGNKMLRQFLAMYQLTGAEKYLEPIEAALKLVEKYYARDISDAAIGSEAWVAGIFKKSPNFAETVELWRLLTGNKKFDHILAEMGSDYLKFRLTGDRQFLFNGSKRVADGILYNQELITTEGYFTDRIDIGNVNKGENWGSNHLESMYGGNALHEVSHPYYDVSWHGFSGNFVAAVVQADRRQVQVIAYNLNAESKEGSISFWTLEPGEYEMQVGPDENDDGITETISVRSQFVVSGHEASQNITLPPSVQQLVQVRQTKSSNKSIHVARADLAVVASDIKTAIDDKKQILRVTVPVHNIGIAAASKIDVQIYLQRDQARKLIGQQTILSIAAPLDLEPRIVTVEFQVDLNLLRNSPVQIVVDEDGQIPEITEMNNQLLLSGDDLMNITGRR